MGSRSSQPVGLCPAAKDYLEARLNNDYKVTGKRHTVEVDWESQTSIAYAETVVKQLFTKEVWSYSGMFDDVPLHRWIFSHGAVIEEHVQWTYWDAGPIEFMALKESGYWLANSLWTPGEVKVMINVDVPKTELDPRKRDTPGPVVY